MFMAVEVYAVTLFSVSSLQRVTVDVAFGVFKSMLRGREIRSYPNEGITKTIWIFDCDTNPTLGLGTEWSCKKRCSTAQNIGPVVPIKKPYWSGADPDFTSTARYLSLLPLTRVFRLDFSEE